MDKGGCANVQRGFAHICSTRAAALQALRNNAQENTQHHVQHRPVALHEVAQALRDRHHPLAHRQTRQDVIGQVRCCSAIAGPRTLQQWQDYLPALDVVVTQADEKLIDGLVHPGHPSTPGYTDAAYPLNGREFK